MGASTCFPPDISRSTIIGAPGEVEATVVPYEKCRWDFFLRLVFSVAAAPPGVGPVKFLES